MRAPLAYRVAGDGIPIVWIHGFPLSSDIFDSVTSIAEAKHVLLDLPGFGATPPDSAIHSIDSYAAAVFATMKELRIEDAVIAGVSMGGYVALAMARIAPRRIRALILIDTRETADSVEAKAQRSATSLRVGDDGVSFLIEQMLPKMLAPSTIAERPGVVSAVRKSMESSTDAGVIAALSALRDRASSATTLATFPNPVLVVVGDQDAITPPEDAERMGRLALDSTVVVLRDAAHLSFLDQPHDFRKTVEEFLRGLSGRDSAE